MTTGSVLVTGGAGYIGSQIVRQLGERGRDVVVLDSLDTGFREAVLYGALVVGDVADPDLVRDILRRYRVKSVIHLAARTIVSESVVDPLRYYRNNTSASCALLDSCIAEGVDHFIFPQRRQFTGPRMNTLSASARPPTLSTLTAHRS